MNICIKTISSCVVLLSLFSLISCKEASDDQQSTTVEVSGSEVQAGVASPGSDVISNNKTGPAVRFSENTLSVYSGETFSLSIVASEFPASEGGGISLRFDPALLEVVNVTIDSAVWDFKIDKGRINNSDGTLLDLLFSSYRGIEGDALIATVDFKSVNSGLSSISLEESTANPFAANGERMSVELNNVTIVAN